MGLHRSSPAWPARLVAACAALFLLVLMLAAAPRAQAQGEDPEFSVLVFSKTTGFRHADAIDAGKVAIPELGEEHGFAVDPDRGRDAVHRPEPPRLRRHRLPQHGRRGHPQRRPADRRRALDVPRRRHRRHPRRRERRPRLGLEGRHARRRMVPQPPVRRPAVPERHGRQRGPVAPRDGGHRGHLDADGRVVQLHRRAARQGPRPRHARRELLRRAGRQRRRRRPPDRVVLELRRRPRLLHGAGPQRLGLAGAAVPRRTSPARSSGPPASPRATAARSARASRRTPPSTR